MCWQACLATIYFSYMRISLTQCHIFMFHSTGNCKNILMEARVKGDLGQRPRQARNAETLTRTDVGTSNGSPSRFIKVLNFHVNIYLLLRNHTFILPPSICDNRPVIVARSFDWRGILSYTLLIVQPKTDYSFPLHLLKFLCALNCCEQCCKISQVGLLSAYNSAYRTCIFIVCSTFEKPEIPWLCPYEWA